MRLQNHRVEFRVTRLSTRWNDSGLGLRLTIGLGLGSELGLNFIELIYQLMIWYTANDLIWYCKSAGKFCHKKFRRVEIRVTRNSTWNSTRRSLKLSYDHSSVCRNYRANLKTAFMTMSSDDKHVQQVDAHSNELVHVVVIKSLHLEIIIITTTTSHAGLWVFCYSWFISLFVATADSSTRSDTIKYNDDDDNNNVSK